ncbi:MAG: hemerythrin domain-containing protein [Chloroflexi bacterium]|nr:hemerythrin domain-containing protein [Chloroflexota bacterium]
MKNRRPTEKFREHHEELLNKLDRMKETITRLESGDAKGAVEGLKQASQFLDNELRPHAKWEEDNLYPAVAQLLKQYGNPTATMELEHEAIVDRIDRFRKDVVAFLSLGGSPKDREQLARQLIKNAWQLEAILSLHFRKEEEVYLSLADSHWTEKDVDKMLGGEH